MDYLPVSLQIQDSDCLIIGGGSIALRKSRQLLKAGANLTLIAPEFHSDLEQLANENKVSLICSVFKSEHLDKQLLVIAATNNLDVNGHVYHEASKKRILVNTVDQPELCQFIMPAVIDRNPLTVAISSSGIAPVFARMLREKFEWFLPKNIGELLSQLKPKRQKVKEKYPKLSERRFFWESYFENILNWSATNNVKNEIPHELDIERIIDIFSVTKTTQELESTCTVINIPTDNFTVGDLTINHLKALQKVDEVYLTPQQYKLLENFIRRDAELHFMDYQIDVDKLTLQKKAQLKNSEPSQVVIIKCT